MSSPPISILDQFFWCRYSNSRDVVASSLFFSCPATRVPWRTCTLLLTPAAVSRLKLVKIDNLNCNVSNHYYWFFMILTIYNGSPPILFFWHKLDSAAKKTHPRVTTNQQTWIKMRNVETTTHTSFSLKPFILYLITKAFGNNVQFSVVLFQTSPSVEGMSEIQAKRFP